MFVFVLVIHIFLCFALIGLVLLQQGKGADLGAAFGSGSASLFGASGAGSALVKATTTAAILFMVTSVFLVRLYPGAMGNYGNESGGETTASDDDVTGSVLEGAPAQVTAAPIAPGGEVAGAPAAAPAGAPAEGSDSPAGSAGPASDLPGSDGGAPNGVQLPDAGTESTAGGTQLPAPGTGAQNAANPASGDTGAAGIKVTGDQPSVDGGSAQLGGPDKAREGVQPGVAEQSGEAGRPDNDLGSDATSRAPDQPAAP